MLATKIFATSMLAKFAFILPVHMILAFMFPILRVSAHIVLDTIDSVSILISPKMLPKIKRSLP